MKIKLYRYDELELTINALNDAIIVIVVIEFRIDASIIYATVVVINVESIVE